MTGNDSCTLLCGLHGHLTVTSAPSADNVQQTDHHQHQLQSTYSQIPYCRSLQSTNYYLALFHLRYRPHTGHGFDGIRDNSQQSANGPTTAATSNCDSNATVGAIDNNFLAIKTCLQYQWPCVSATVAEFTSESTAKLHASHSNKSACVTSQGKQSANQRAVTVQTLNPVDNYTDRPTACTCVLSQRVLVRIGKLPF